ncbi:MAG TPA: PLP-dependent aminotransferase family protein, partial [Thermoanaerobaculia bacterium]|nr:PLP-dependent aminotransferase family protein [Thermoanaerobaculia bacterium]
ITPVTVTRAYAEAARRGLVEASTGRGTYVRAARREPVPASEIDLATNAINIPLPVPSPAVLRRAAETLDANYSHGPGSERHRAAGAAWIGRQSEASRVIVTAGTQHAIFVAFSATTRPGDTMLTESLTYHGAKAAAALLGLKLAPLPMDRYGLLPDALARACRARTAKVLYTIPSLHNPTGIVMPEKRRREIAAVAEKYGITIIEDDVCGFLLEKTPPAIATFAPERTLLLTGLGKSIAAGMRVGYVAVPEPLLARAQSVFAASVLFTSPLLAEIATSWIEDGTAARIVAQKRAEAALRSRVARRILGDRASKTDPRSGHLWIELPRRWHPDAFAEAARRRRVRVASASSFAVGSDIPRAVRLSIGAPASVAELETALGVIMGIDEEREEAVV